MDDKLKPKLFSVMKSYTKEQFVKDIVAGIIVAIIALPLSIALALASGVTPEKGIYTAITAGFVISFLGGSRVQIAGPTAAFATIVAQIVAENGVEGLAVATVLAGIILIIMGLCKMGSLIKFIPYTITTGFTAGIAVTIFVGQIKDFLGLTVVSKEPLIETMDKLKAVFDFIHTTNWQAVIRRCCLHGDPDRLAVSAGDLQEDSSFPDRSACEHCHGERPENAGKYPLEISTPLPMPCRPLLFRP